MHRLMPRTATSAIVEEGVEVVKILEDSYEDCKRFMMEMIVKKIFEVAELERFESGELQRESGELQRE
ncbi:unnamed protein product [Microthlaspi erraticum]|uniref:Ovate family protein n=1 Tax=Microthlaspi erraticum TaxID=1685480 RepID=A0A6D2JUR2_9BRAS|nr:unnamed protein product [Microthlaspi erraticum]